MQIKEILEKNNIAFLETGNNVKKGNISIKCPFCTNDPSYHMGINLETGVYGCWRDSSHRGKNFSWVLRKLLKCSIEEAKNILNNRVLDSDWKSKVLNKLNHTQEKEIPHIKNLKLPTQFKKISQTGYTSIFWEFLLARGFKDVNKIINRYRIKCCLTGDWRRRLIFPLYFKGNLISWGSRSVSTNEKLKYKDLGVLESVIYPKHFLYNFDNLYEYGGTVLYITEGIFDFLKMDLFLPLKYKATCLFTKTITNQQLEMLLLLSTKFKEIRVLLDSDAYLQSLKLVSQLKILPIKITNYKLPNGRKDPGELSYNEVRKYFGV